MDLAVGPGEIHALVGENGAGKSTLIKILAGVHQADAGEVRLLGQRVDPYGATLPLSFVHQDLGLVDELSVGENVALVAGFPRRAGLIDWPRVWARAREIYLAMAVAPPDPRLPVGALSAASKAVLGIVRALARQARVVVLDEPTAALPEPDAAHLFDVLRRLRASGCSVIYVSHRLGELFGLADRVTVLRDGRRVRVAAMADITPQQLVEDMLGRSLEPLHAAHPTETHARPLLAVAALENAQAGPVSFQIGAGEIVGLVGLRGAGHEAIGRMIFGALRPRGGTIRLNGAVLPAGEDVAARIARGIALLPGDRGRESALGGMSLIENLLPSAAIGGRPGLAAAAAGAGAAASAGGSRPARRAPARPGGADRLAQRRQPAEGLRRPLAGGEGAALRDGRADGGDRHRREIRDPRSARRRGAGGGGDPRGLLRLRGSGDPVRPRAGDRARADHLGTARAGADGGQPGGSRLDRRGSRGWSGSERRWMNR